MGTGMHWSCGRQRAPGMHRTTQPRPQRSAGQRVPLTVRRFLDMSPKSWRCNQHTIVQHSATCCTVQRPCCTVYGAARCNGCSVLQRVQHTATALQRAQHAANRCDTLRRVLGFLDTLKSQVGGATSPNCAACATLSAARGVNSGSASEATCVATLTASSSVAISCTAAAA